MKEALSSEEREALLIKLWMSHDARWFAAAAMECGMETANRLNQTAAHAVGKKEAPLLLRAFEMSPVRNRDDFVAAQAAFIGFLGPDLLDYEMEAVGDDSCDIKVKRCFAFDQVSRAGVAQQYDCGILPRITGWLEGLGLEHELSPTIGPCLMAAGKPCVYRVTVKPSAPEE
jgi:hypothetical protein